MMLLFRRSFILNKQLRKTRKRPLLLLELLIAMILVGLSVIPLLVPHAVMLKEEGEALALMEVNEVLNNTYADVMEGLYESRYSWAEIQSGREHSLSADVLDRMGYVATYSLSVSKGRSGRELVKGDPGKYYLLDLAIKAEPQRNRKGRVVEVVYKIFIEKEDKGEDSHG